MEEFLKEYAILHKYNCDSIISAYKYLDKKRMRYGSNGVIILYGNNILNGLIDLKIKIGRDPYKQDMPILCNIFLKHIDFVNYDDFILCVNKILEENNILNISLKIINNLRYLYRDYHILMSYYIGTFLEDEPADIKIALKD